MAVSYKPADGTQVVIAASGTVVTAGTQPFDNTHTVVILNNTAGVEGYANWQSNTTQITAITGMVIPANGSLVLSIGPLSERPGAGDTLRFDGAAACTFQLTYVNSISS